MEVTMVSRKAEEALRTLKSIIKGGRRMAPRELGKLSSLIIMMLSLKEGEDDLRQMIEKNGNIDPHVAAELRESVPDALFRKAVTALGDVDDETLREVLTLLDEEMEPDMTPGSVIETAMRLLSPMEGRTVAEIGSGRGTFMRKLSSEGFRGTSYTGYEIDPFRWAWSAAVSGKRDERMTVLLSDAFLEAQKDPDRHYDRIFSSYPLGAKLSQRRAVNELSKRLGIEPQAIVSSDWAFSTLLCSMMSDDGRAVGVMSQGALCNASDQDARRSFLAKGLIEAVMDLPEKVFGNTPIRTSLVVFSRNNSEVKLIDARDMVLAGRKGSGPDPERILSEYSLISGGKPSERSRIVTSEELREKGYILSAERWRNLPEKDSGLIPMKDVLLSVTRGTSMKEKDITALKTLRDTGIRFLMPSDITERGIDSGSLPHLEEPGESERKYMAEDGDMVITKTVSPLRAAVLSLPEGERVLVSGNLYIVRIDRDKADPRFLIDWLSSKKGQELVRSVAVGTQVKLLSRSSLDELPIPGIGLSRQREILSRIDIIEREKEEIRNRLEELGEEEESLITGCLS